MPFSVEHNATSEWTDWTDFECGHCKYESVAVVRTKGTGESSNTFGLLNPNAKEKAVDASKNDGENNLELLGSFGRCPNCGQRNEAGIASLRTGAYMKSVGIAVGGLLLWVILDSGKGRLSPMVLGIAALVLIWALTNRESWKWSEIDARVKVLNEPELAAFEAELPDNEEVKEPVQASALSTP